MKAIDKSKIHFSRDYSDINFDLVFDFLSDSYWGHRYIKERYREAIKNSIVISMFLDGLQVGFARIVTDGYLVGYLADVFIVEQYQKCGLGSLMLKELFDSEDVNQISRITLSTKDGHKFYEQFGFIALRFPENQMERLSRTV